MQSPSLVAFMAGLVGTSAMLGFLHLLAYGRAIESRLPLALGILVTKHDDARANRTGLALHYAFGMMFAFLYTHLIILARPESRITIVFLGLIMGLVHGVFATMFMIGLADRHPLKSFRESPVASSLAHGVAHLVFGLAVGLTVLALGGGPAA